MTSPEDHYVMLYGGVADALYNTNEALHTLTVEGGVVVPGGVVPDFDLLGALQRAQRALVEAQDALETRHSALTSTPGDGMVSP